MKPVTVKLFGLATTLGAVMATGAPWVDAQEEPQGIEPVHEQPDVTAEAVTTHHRLDLGFDRFGRSDQHVTTVSLGYTWAPGEHHSFNLTTKLVDPEGLGPVGENGGFLVSDTELYYSWSGNYRVDAGPWLPNRFGSGLGVFVPTGDAARGAGLDMWVAMPYLGVVRAVTKKLTITPTLTFAQSFAEGDLAVPLQAVGAEIGLLYAIAPRWWIFYRPTIFRDFELSETVILNLLQLGRQIGKRHGISLEYGRVNDERYSLEVGFRSNSNYRLTLQGHIGFK